MPDGSFNTRMIPALAREAQIRSQSLDPEKRTVDICWTTGATVRRHRWFEGEIDEELIVTPNAIRMDRLNDGAPFLNSHRAAALDSVLGVIVRGSARLEGGKGYATIRFSDREDVEPVFRDVVNGILSKVSVGYRVHKYEIEKRDGQVDLWRAVDWEPYEISAVTIPADPGASVRSESDAKNECILTRRDANAGFPAIKSKGSENMPDGNTPALTPDEIRAAERSRFALINDLARRHQLDDNWRNRALDLGEQEIRNSALDMVAERDIRDDPPGASQLSDPSRSHGHFEPVQTALEAMVQGRSVPAEVANVIGGRRFADICKYFLRSSGFSVGSMSESRVVAAALERRAYAAQGTGDFPILLENVLNKTLLARQHRPPSGIRKVSFKNFATDFRPQNRYRGGTFGELEDLNEHGNIRATSIPDGARESISLKTKAGIVAITRQALINDDLGALADIATMAGDGIAATVNNVLTRTVESPPNMSDGNPAFHDSHGNLATAGAALSETSLQEGKLAMRLQTDINGERVGISPKFLLVPPQLEIPAQKLLSSIQAAKTSDVNPHTDLELVVESRLLDSDAWYLVADPDEIRGLEYCFLDGAEGGTVEVRTGWEVDGIEVRSVLDLGAAFIDTRGWWKNPGA